MNKEIETNDEYIDNIIQEVRDDELAYQSYNDYENQQYVNEYLKGIGFI